MAKGERLVFSIGIAETTGYAYVGEKNEPDSYLTIYTKINSR